MVAPTTPKTTPYQKKDFQSDQEIRWCPGCGDYAILNAAQQVFAQLGFPKHKMVMVSGIGCSSRFPYYVNTYGFQSTPCAGTWTSRSCSSTTASTV